MTKRIVATWFCKTVAITGMIFSLGQIVPFAVRLFGIQTFVNPVAGIIHFVLYFFVWILAQNLGSEIAAEGEYGEPIGSTKELSVMTTRCAGFAVFLQGATSLASFILYAVSNYFILPTSARNSFMTMSIPSIIIGVIMALIGFVLAFGPRIRQAFR